MSDTSLWGKVSVRRERAGDISGGETISSPRALNEGSEGQHSNVAGPGDEGRRTAQRRMAQDDDPRLRTDALEVHDYLIGTLLRILSGILAACPSLHDMIEIVN